jgi:hypothetical protein
MEPVRTPAAHLALASLFTVLLAACSGGGYGGSTATPAPTPPPPPVANRAPVASFTVTSTTVTAGSALAFDATGSSDPNGDALTYSWDFGDGSRGGGATLAHLYATAGSFTATLTVSDGRGGVTRTTRALTATAAAAPGPTVTVHGTVGDLAGVLAGVTVQPVGGTTTATTATDGTVSLLLASGTPLVLHLTKAGYADQFIPIRIPSGAANAEFTAGMLPRQAAVPLNADTGGTLTGKDGAALTLDAAALVDANGNAVTGTVQVNISPVDIRGGGAAQFPGAFAGVMPDGRTVPIVSYGTVEYQLTVNGQRVQIAAGKTASVDLPIYASRNLDKTAVAAGQTIPLWSLDEVTGTWVQEGQGTVVASTASPTGFALRARVAHLSWWNGDFPLLPPFPFTVTISCDLRTLPANSVTAVPCSVAPPLPKDFPPVQPSDNFQPQSLQRFEVGTGGTSVTMPIGVPFTFFACTRQATVTCGSASIAGDPAVDSTVVIHLTQTQADTCTNPQSVTSPTTVALALQPLEIRCLHLVVPTSQVVRVGVSADVANTVNGRKRVKDANGTVLGDAAWLNAKPDVVPLKLPLAAGTYVVEVENTTLNPGAATLDLSLIAPIAVTVPSITSVTLLNGESQAFDFTPTPNTLVLATALGVRPTLSSTLNAVTDPGTFGWATLMLRPTTSAPISVQLANGGGGTQAYRFRLATPPRIAADVPQDASFTSASDLLVKQFVYDAAGGETIAFQARMPAGFAGNGPVNVQLFDANGVELEPLSNVASKFRNGNNLVAVTLPAAGPYRIDLTSKFQADVSGLTAGLSVLPAPTPFALTGETSSLTSSIDTLAAARGHQVTLARGDLVSVDLDVGTAATRLRPTLYLRSPAATGSPYLGTALSPRDSFGFFHPGEPLPMNVVGAHGVTDVVSIPADGSYLLHVAGGSASLFGGTGALSMDGVTGPYTLTMRRPTPTAPLAPNAPLAVTAPAFGFVNVTLNPTTAGAYLLCQVNGSGGAVLTKLFDAAGVEQTSTLSGSRVAWNLVPGTYHWSVRPAPSASATPITVLWQLATDPIAPTCL